ncbi:uncharacterized protein N7446_010891 [Penicillium canescens]|uniref:Xaa-Pro dipeptidyl-peptidase C-terminal domain-containing protein n=1 Tax=Penicillium canescens TaxID=5083 RepID=A0AAD6IHR3_PENCN|nr:uncharacterized protein N7446_010891 [Penicillium canescens]KAJ6029759.1 hypothetical protein N7444_012746 [Penicillium canescens]KAJ6048192.1 hypothetical protein N7460_004339 [Penicillium canescens]KAJ6048208.1 hypothetical protein N7446_010891 [Penicillium canescens]
MRPELSDSRYDGPDACTSILPRGFRKSPENAPFQIDTVFEKDVKISLRDGTQIRADIFRPHDAAGSVPGLIAWSPYGKTGRGHFRLDVVPGRVGVPVARLSGFEKFEAPDPAEWTARGYAIVNVDSRGVYDSEGDIRWFGSAEGRDGYDVVEQVAKMPWCSGSIALVGNSWLAMAQWFIAAERPPHLKCIAPLEGASDVYRELLCRGGVPQTAFWDYLANLMVGRNQQEDVKAMLEKYPRTNEYWEDKRAQISRIDVPVYVLASYSTFLHTMGSFRGFEEIQHKNKWLRVHPTQEWYDLYQPSTNDELQLFFDRYTKDIQNDWEKTPRVRISLLQFNREPITNVPCDDWPLASTRHEKLFLCENDSLAKTAPLDGGSVSYQSDEVSLQMDADREELSFQYTFPHRALFVGCARVVLYMSCNDHDDMDVFVQVRKADRKGRTLQNMNIPLSDLNMDAYDVDTVNPLKYLGPTGVLRASHRDIDLDLSNTSWTEHDYSRNSPVPRGQVVRMEIGLWQTGIVFDAGEKIVLKVSGHNMTLAEFPPLRGALLNGNVGSHYVHFGGSYQSHLLVPLVDLPLGAHEETTLCGTRASGL